MISRAVINGLKCSVCKKSLSIFPIYTYGSKDTVVCGRCPIQNEFLPQRQDVFEELAQHIEFPCRYQDNGCIEKLKPNEMKNHEERCPHKPCLCPILPLGQCKWYGEYTDLFDHYKESHPALSFTNFRIEVDIISSYEENYVFQHEDETFIAQLKCNTAAGKFYSNVICPGTESESKTLSYRVCFTNNKQNFFCQIHYVEYTDIGTFTVNDNTTVIDINDILASLNNPGCVLCVVEVIVKKTASANEKPSYVEDENEMLKTLECPICFEYMVPPIMQCNTGCSFCGHHREDLSECPKCRGTVGATRNYTLEQITNIIEYPCKNNETGCSYRSSAKNIRQHEDGCVYGPVKCIIDSCSWKNKFSDLKPHLQQIHKDNILEISFLTYFLSEYTTDEDLTYVFFGGNDNIFKLLFHRYGDVFMWALQIVGNDKDYANHMLELDFDDKDRIYIRKRCGPLVDSNSIKDDSVIRINMDSLKNFIVDDMLVYKVRIIEVK